MEWATDATGDPLCRVRGDKVRFNGGRNSLDRFVLYLFLFVLFLHLKQELDEDADESDESFPIK